MSLADKRVLVVGLGGLGSPTALTLAQSGVRRFTLLDEDDVEITNLHRQILYDERDVGRPKLERAAVRLRSSGAEVDARSGRLAPSNAVAQLEGHDLVVEGADNFATKFLACDASGLTGVPLVSAGAVCWSGWAMASVPGASACLRCVFEDIPQDRMDTCADAGVAGPLLGVLGGIQAALALRILLGDASAGGELWSFRGLDGQLRARATRRRAGCPACERRHPTLSVDLYVPRLDSAAGTP
ncbi:MAG: HesA/MoeB/ThiF family protein [Sandaracinaceae bacterium]